MTFYILCKNEAPNIRKCIEHLLAAGMEVVVLDSGSTDDTLEIVRAYPVQLEAYTYTNHCNAYNDITQRHTAGYCGIVDADMELTPALAAEIRQVHHRFDVLISPIEMYVDGFALEKGSLCPPKAIVFKHGQAYFESVGHGERLVEGVNIGYTRATLPHNDLKPYIAYLGSQVRYADQFIRRAQSNQITWRDRLRMRTPLLILITPLYSLLVKGGLFSRKGWLYALDRLIAEAVMYRRSVLERVKSNT